MKTRLLFLLACLFLSLGVIKAQQPQDDRYKKIEAARIAYITEQLSLTTTEVTRFFPVYKKYSMIKHQMFRKQKIEKTHINEVDFDTKVIQLKKYFELKFAELIGAGRAKKVFDVEQEFRTILFKKLLEQQSKD